MISFGTPPDWSVRPSLAKIILGAPDRPLDIVTRADWIMKSRKNLLLGLGLDHEIKNLGLGLRVPRMWLAV